MAPAPKPKKKGLMGLSPVAWGGIGVAGLVVFYLYRRSQASAAATAANTAAQQAATPSTSTSTGTGLPSFSSFAQWEQSALASITSNKYSPTQALNDISQWVNGGCVSQMGYTALGNFIAAGGIPPGFGSALPTLSVCPATTPPPVSATTPPPTSTNIPPPVTPTPPSPPTPPPAYVPPRTATGSTPPPSSGPDPFGVGGIFGTLIPGSLLGLGGGLWNYISTPAYATQLASEGVAVQQANGHEYWQVG